MAANHGAPVRAGIEEYPNLAVLASDKEQRLAGDRASAVVSGALDLRFVSQVDPASIEDQFLFPLEQIQRRHARSMDPKNPAIPVVNDQVLDFHRRANTRSAPVSVGRPLSRMTRSPTPRPNMSFREDACLAIRAVSQKRTRRLQ